MFDVRRLILLLFNPGEVSFEGSLFHPPGYAGQAGFKVEKPLK
jgi:hypothetical protein